MSVLHFMGVCISFALLGCGAHGLPFQKEIIPFMERSQTKRQAGLEVTVAMPSKKEVEDIFDSNLIDNNIQPIWIHIKNNQDKPYMFLPLLVDQNYYPPYEVTYKLDISKEEKGYTAIQEKSIHHFIKPRGEIEGYIFTNLVHGTKRITIGVIGHGSLETFVFYVQDPGIQFDYQRMDFEHLYPAHERIYLSEAELRENLERLPCCTTSQDGRELGDPLNIVIIGDFERVLNAFIDNGWDETELLTTQNMVRAARAFLSGSSYRHTIISPLYCFGRMQDLSMQKPRKTISARNHLRLWMTPMMFKNDPVWIGQISRDVGVRMTLETWPPFTHKISPVVDEAREYLVENMVISNRLAELGFVRGLKWVSPSDPRRNLTGDPYFTDGLRAVLVIADTPTQINQIELLNWEWPSEYRDVIDFIF